jgi:hypothetical protein
MRMALQLLSFPTLSAKDLPILTSIGAKGLLGRLPLRLNQIPV